MKIFNKIILILFLSLLLPFFILFSSLEISLQAKNHNFVKKHLFQKALLARSHIISAEESFFISVKSRLTRYPTPKDFLENAPYDYANFFSSIDSVPKRFQKQLKEGLPVTYYSLSDRNIFFEIYYPYVNPVSRKVCGYFHVLKNFSAEEIAHLLEIGLDEIFVIYGLRQGKAVPLLGNTYDNYGRKFYPVLSSGSKLYRSLETKQSQIQKNIIFQKKHYNVIFIPVPKFEKSAILAIGLSDDKVRRLYGWVARLFVVFLILTLVVSLFSAYQIAHLFLSSIEQISDFSQSVISGDLEQHLNIRRKDEIGQLAKNINLMVSRLKDSLKKESRFSERLQLEVNERTNDLNIAIRDLKNRERILEQDMKLAKIIQQKLLGVVSSSSNVFESFVYYRPLFQVGGDFYQFSEITPLYYRFFLADATGHGIQAALTTVIIKGEYDKLKSQSIFPSEVLRRLNQAFIKGYRDLTVFFSAIVVDFDLKKRQFYFASSGHPDQFLYRQNRLITLRSTGSMTGVLEEEDYRQIKHALYPGDLLIFFTDGIFEEFNENEEELGDERFKELVFESVRGNEDTDLPVLAQAILSKIRDFQENSPVNDDISLILIHIKEFGIESLNTKG